MNEIDAPNVVGMLRAQTDYGTVFVIKPLSLLVAMRWLQTLFAPQSFDLLLIDLPALNAKKFSNLAVAVTAILLGQSDQSLSKAVIFLLYGLIVMCGSRHANRFACMPFREAKLLTHMDDSLAKIGNRQTLSFKKSRLSFKISLSSSSSTTAVVSVHSSAGSFLSQSP